MPKLFFLLTILSLSPNPSPQKSNMEHSSLIPFIQGVPAFINIEIALRLHLISVQLSLCSWDMRPRTLFSSEITFSGIRIFKKRQARFWWRCIWYFKTRHPWQRPSVKNENRVSPVSRLRHWAIYHQSVPSFDAESLPAWKTGKLIKT